MKRMPTLFALFLFVSLSISSASGHVAGAQDETSTAVDLPSPGLTPHSPFYFLDRLGEALQEFLTFNPQAKARLQLAFAEERIAEIKLVLETRGVEAPGIAIAEARLGQNLVRAAAFLEKERSEGEDVGGLARALNDDVNMKKEVLKKIFEGQKNTLKQEEERLTEEIAAAKSAGDSVLEIQLRDQLEEVIRKRKMLREKEDEQKDLLRSAEKELEKNLEKRDEAFEAIREAEEEREELSDDAEEDGEKISDITEKQFEQLLSQAKELFAKESYEGAKQLAEQAKERLEKEGEREDESSEAEKSDIEEREGEDEKEKRDEGKSLNGEETEREAKEIEELLEGLED